MLWNKHPWSFFSWSFAYKQKQFLHTSDFALFEDAIVLLYTTFIMNLKGISSKTEICSYITHHVYVHLLYTHHWSCLQLSPLHNTSLIMFTAVSFTSITDHVYSCLLYMHHWSCLQLPPLHSSLNYHVYSCLCCIHHWSCLQLSPLHAPLIMFTAVSFTYTTDHVYICLLHIHNKDFILVLWQNKFYTKWNLF